MRRKHNQATKISANAAQNPLDFPLFHLTILLSQEFNLIFIPSPF
jgi:hypothetical protein